MSRLLAPTVLDMQGKRVKWHLPSTGKDFLYLHQLSIQKLLSWPSIQIQRAQDMCWLQWHIHWDIDSKVIIYKKYNNYDNNEDDNNGNNIDDNDDDNNDNDDDDPLYLHSKLFLAFSRWNLSWYHYVYRNNILNNINFPNLRFMRMATSYWDIQAQKYMSYSGSNISYGL